MGKSNLTNHSFCEKISICCDKSQYNEANIWEKIKLKLHLLICKECKKYAKKNHRLSHIINRANLQHLNPGEQEKLKTLIHQEFQSSKKQ